MYIGIRVFYDQLTLEITLVTFNYFKNFLFFILFLYSSAITNTNIYFYYIFYDGKIFK